MKTSWTRCEDNSNFDRELINFLVKQPFWTEISRHMAKVPSKDLPTAAVTYNVEADELQMWYNPDFVAKQTPNQIRGLIQHELSHVVFGHLNSRRKDPHTLWNIGTDCAINSMIDEQHGAVSRDSNGNSATLPDCGLIPGKRPAIDPEIAAKMDPEQLKRTTDLADVIAALPKLKSSEWYFNKINEEMKDKGHDMSDADGGILIEIEGSGGDMEGDGTSSSKKHKVAVVGSMDDHGGWDGIPDEMREYVEGKIRSIVEKAVEHADKQANGWGNIPHEIASEIRRSVSTIVNWRSVLRQFVGSLVRGERTSSIKRINRRYPYIHPGVKRGYTARLLIAIDQSGSVSDSMLESFAAELATLTKRISVDILPFDCDAKEKDIFEWRKGTRPQLKRIRSGGTDFNAPNRIVNDPKNRGRWDGVLVCTDGEAPAPEGSRVKRGWVLGAGQKLYFNSDELQVFIDEAKPMQGAWR